MPAPSVASGVTNHLIAPQSNVCVGTAFGSTACTDSSFDRDGLEAPHGLGQGDFGRQALHARGAEEADDPVRASEYVRGVLGLGDRAAVAEHEDVRVDLL